jgi:hypothetical protein
MESRVQILSGGALPTYQVVASLKSIAWYSQSLDNRLTMHTSHRENILFTDPEVSGWDYSSQGELIDHGMERWNFDNTHANRNFG